MNTYTILTRRGLTQVRGKVFTVGNNKFIVHRELRSDYTLSTEYYTISEFTTGLNAMRLTMDKYTRHINKLVKAALDEAPNYDKLLTPEFLKYNFDRSTKGHPEVKYPVNK